MKKSFIPPSVLRQKAKQLKKEKSLSHHLALDGAAIYYGFANHKNYLNEAKVNRSSVRTLRQFF